MYIKLCGSLDKIKLFMRVYEKNVKVYGICFYLSPKYIKLCITLSSFFTICSCILSSIVNELFSNEFWLMKIKNNF